MFFLMIGNSVSVIYGFPDRTTYQLNLGYTDPLWEWREKLKLLIPTRSGRPGGGSASI